MIMKTGRVKAVKRILGLILVTSIVLILFSCKPPGQEQEEEENIQEDPGIYDIDQKGIPKFVSTNYIQLAKIHRISRFRSGIGHSYSDDFESCRSMKHYYSPLASINWSGVKIYSPVTGTVSKNEAGWAGSQIRIKSDQYPAFYFILFHVNLAQDLPVGTRVTAGQALGNHIGSQTMSDIAVGVNTPGGWKLVSYFDVLQDTLFQTYQNRGVASRNELIISRSARDGDPLTCDGEDFANQGNIQNWVTLN